MTISCESAFVIFAATVPFAIFILWVLYKIATKDSKKRSVSKESKESTPKNVQIIKRIKQAPSPQTQLSSVVQKIATVKPEITVAVLKKWLHEEITGKEK